MDRAFQRGFTLIELLVATAVLALMGLVAFEGLRFATRAWSTTVVRAARADDIWTTQRFLRGRLEALYPFEPSSAGGGRVFAVEGETEEIVFTAPLPAAGAHAGFQRFRVFTRRDGDSTALWVAWRLDRNGQADELNPHAWNEEKLLGNLSDIRWDYLEVREGQAPEWVPRWQEQASSPQLLRLRIDFPPGDERVWPELVVRPRITASARCAFDVVSRRCRSAT